MRRTPIYVDLVVYNLKIVNVRDKLLPVNENHQLLFDAPKGVLQHILVAALFAYAFH